MIKVTWCQVRAIWQKFKTHPSKLLQQGCNLLQCVQYLHWLAETQQSWRPASVTICVWPPINVTQLHGSLSSDCCLAFHFPTSHIAAQSKGRASCNMLSDHAQASLAPSDNKPPGSAAYCKRHYALCHIQGLTWLKCDIKSLFCCHKPVHKCVLQCMPFWKWVACHASHHHNTDSPFSKQSTPLCYVMTAHDIVTIHFNKLLMN